MNQPHSGEILVTNMRALKSKEPRSGETKTRIECKIFRTTKHANQLKIR